MKSGSAEEWKVLYTFSSKINDIQPWKFMEETDLFGVQNPVNKEIGFISVMGTLGEHIGLSVYLGSEGLLGFWGMAYADPSTPAEILLEIPHLQVSFENKENLDNKDLELTRKLGLKFKSPDSYPMFRSIVPGFLPWFLEKDEVLFLTCVLEQSIDVMLRFKKNNSILDIDDERYLIRIPVDTKALKWNDKFIKIPLPEIKSTPFVVDEKFNKKCQGLRKVKMEIELDLFMIPAAIGENKKVRPSNAYALMAVDSENGLVIGVDLLSVKTSLMEMWGRVPTSSLKLLSGTEMIPSDISVRSERMYDFLKPLADTVGFSLRMSNELPALNQSKRSLLESFGRR